MRAIVKTAEGPGHVRLEEIDEPRAGPGQVVMRVMAGGICGTDVHIVHGSLAVRPPLVLGHELSGIAAELGEGVAGLKVGDRITTETDAFVCGSCPYCRAGDVHLCPLRKAIGTSAPGGFAELVAVPASGVHQLPAGTDFAAGALTEPLAVAVHAVAERGEVRSKERVVVIGPGTVGMLAACVAVARGAEVTLGGLARHAARFRLARELGIARSVMIDDSAAMEALFHGDDGLGVHRVIECSGAPEARAAGLRLLRRGGSLVEVGFAGTSDGKFDFDAMVNKEISVVASRGKRPSSFREAVRFVSTGRIDPGRLITDRFPMADWQMAFKTAELPGRKVVLEVGAG
jgi:L-iditol 2-dehydrogenase